MEWIEKHPLPSKCQNCQEEDCYNCDYAGDRWRLSLKDDLQLRRKSLMKAIERLQKQIQSIDTQFLALSDAPVCASTDD